MRKKTSTTQKTTEKPETQKTTEKPRIMRAPSHRKFYVTNIHGGLTSQDIRFELLNEKMFSDDGEKSTFVSDALVIFSPVGAKRLNILLSKAINEYESENGTIDVDIKDEKRI